MRVRTTALAVCTAIVAMGVAATARAETVPPVNANPITQFAGEARPWTAPPPRKTLQLDTKGRWGLRLDMNQLSNRETEWKDVQAGAFFRITPSLRVGGSVALTDNKLAPAQKVTTPGETNTPRVHLETNFRF